MTGKKPLIIANWKASFNEDTVKVWLDKAGEVLKNNEKAEIVICPPFVFISELKFFFEDGLVKVGAQDVSVFENGAYTGEVTASALSSLVNYCIVGHSERKKYFLETEEKIAQKVKNLLEINIRPILCVADLSQLDRYFTQIPALIDKRDQIVFVYEPPSSISTPGHFQPEDPQKAKETTQKMREKLGENVRIIYGGSTNAENIGDFLSQNDISGALVGQASWTAESFLSLLDNLP